jgi:hypothetical protein
MRDVPHLCWTALQLLMSNLLRMALPCTPPPCQHAWVIKHQSLQPAHGHCPTLCARSVKEKLQGHMQSKRLMAGCLRQFAGSRKGRLAWDLASLTGECSSSNSQRKA